MDRLALNSNANNVMRFCFRLITTKHKSNKLVIRGLGSHACYGWHPCPAIHTIHPNRSLLSSNNIFHEFHTNNKLLLNSRPLFRSFSQFNDSIIAVSDEIRSALRERRPIVALESTIITHGMPFPINLETAQSVEAIVREEGVIPATIAVLGGQICVGLDQNQLQHLAKESQSGRLLKISRSDLPFVVANDGSGGTTVSATSLISSRCGIDIFVTGGIGGVHRGVEQSWDISADLTELGRTPIAVICAGVKSILDIPKTLEYLETQGVCVMVFDGDKCSEKEVEFPAFFTRNSGSRIAYSADTSKEVAEVIAHHKRLALESGIVIAVPIPFENQSVSESVNNAINEALSEVKIKNISGKKVTPYVLERVNQLSAGSSLLANIALIRNNARVGARIAVQYERIIAERSELLADARRPSIGLRKDLRITNGGDYSSRLSKAGIQSIGTTKSKQRELIERNANQSEETRELSPVVIGGSIYDIIATADSKSLSVCPIASYSTIKSLKYL